MTLPTLRNVDIIPVEQDGKPYFCLRDQEGIVEAQLLLSPLALFIATQLDGNTDEASIEREFHVLTGQTLPADTIQEVADFLDAQGFLFTETYLELRRAVTEAYRQCPTRSAYLAGSAYPSEPEALRTFLDEMFAQHDLLVGLRREPESTNGTPLRGLIVPHIDYERGRASYAQSYSRMASHGAPEIAFVFGVAHAAPPVPFVLSMKDFETPLGAVATDRAVIERLARACSWDPFEHEIVHRTEHSVEFHAVMLAYLFGGKTRIVPILCSDFSGGQPGDIAAIDSFLQECASIVREGKGTIAVIAGADLAHVGRRFGDSFEITDEIVKEVERRDAQDLNHVLKPDAAAWYRSVMTDQNARRVCGLNCIYSALRSLEGVVQEGELLHYGYAPDPNGGIVSFAGVALG